MSAFCCFKISLQSFQYFFPTLLLLSYSQLWYSSSLKRHLNNKLNHGFTHGSHVSFSPVIIALFFKEIMVLELSCFVLHFLPFCIPHILLLYTLLPYTKLSIFYRTVEYQLKWKYVIKISHKIELITTWSYYD